MVQASRTLRVAVIGTGNIGKHHVRILTSLPHVSLVAIAEKIEERRQALQTLYGFKTYNDVAELLNNEDIDAVIVAVPTRWHFTVAKQTLMQRIPTLIEKPIAATVAEAKSLIALAQKKKTLLFVGHVERFNTAISKVKTMLTDREIGTIVSLVAKRVGLFPPQSPDTNVVVDLAVHDIDIFSYLLGEKPTRVSASGGKIILKNFMDHAELFFHYPSGTSGYIQASWITPVKIRTLSIIGTEGYIELDYIKQAIQLVHNTLTNPLFDSYGQFILKSEPTKKILFSGVPEEPLKLELVSFLENIRQKKPATVSGQVGLEALEIAARAVKDMQSQRS